MTGRILGHYEVLEKIGAGGMGEVYKARDTHLDRFVTIKVLHADAVADPERTRRFVQEAKAASALNHPNIVTIHDIARADGMDYIVMEYVAGRTLDQMIGRGGMKLGDLLHAAIQAADALARAHAAGIVHRDLKPSNIMVTDDGRVKILDFGLAKLAPAAVSESAETTVRPDQVQTGEGWVVGTPAYMSPEQAEGKTVDARSDIFSFGAVLYEMATGVSPFRGESAASTMAAVLMATPAPPSQSAPHLPREIDRVISRCLRKEASRRYQSMADVTLELEEIKTESGEWFTEPASSGPLNQRIESTKGVPAARRRWPWIAAAAGAAGIVVVGAALAWSRWPASSTAPPALVALTTDQGIEDMPSVSPDGSQVAFVWTGARQNNSDIYVKPIDSAASLRLTTDPLPDYFPAWSPNGRQIAFARFPSDSRAAVYVTPPIPGAERKVADVEIVPASIAPILAQASLSWTPDGQWVIVAGAGPRDDENGLFLIPIEAGERRTILVAQTASARVGRPVMSRSGHDVAYMVCLPTSQACDIWLQPLTQNFQPQGDARRLTNFQAQITGLTWTPDERSLIAGVTASQNAFSHLWRVPIGGEAPTRLDWAGSAVRSPSMSPSGRLAVSTGDGSALDIWRFDLSASGAPPRQHPVSSTLADVDPSFSPDGSKIAFGSARSGQGQEIWTASREGTSLTQVTRNGNGRNRGSPRWSHDGRRIAYDSPNENGLRGTYVVDAAGGESREVSGGHGYFPVWSADDQWIYFNSARSGLLTIWRAPSSGGPAEQVTREGGSAPRLSADGRTLFYRRAATIFSRPAGGGVERTVADGVFGQSGSYDVYGSEIFYVSRPDPAEPIALEIRTTDVATGRTRTVSRFDGNSALGMSVSPDGKTILLAVFKAGSDLMLAQNFQ